MSESRWQAIIFDLDDTLYPERDHVLSGFRAVAGWLEERAGVPAAQAFGELAALYEAGVRGETYNRWLAARGLPDELVPEMVRVYREHAPALAPFPDAVALLAALRPHYRLGLVSDGYLAVQQRKLAALGLAGCFDAVVFSDQWGRDAWKPSARPFLAALQALGAVAEWAVYVADNPAKDFLGARQLGMYTARVRRAGGEYARLAPPSEQHAPHITVTVLGELPGALSLRVG